MQVKDNPEKTSEVNITRVFNAPRELVFKAWADPDLLLKWFAPEGCSIRYTELDIRKGGKFHSCLTHPRFGDCWCKGIYHEVVFPERIEYSIMLSDADGNAVDPVDAGKDAGWPGETRVTVLFTEDQGKTKLTLTQTVSSALAKKTGAYSGWIQMLERLDKEIYHLDKL
jgi:uncharacterized protein YndB with AHSA1/START domain